MTRAALIALLGRLRLDLSDEKRTQAGVESALLASGPRFVREKRLSVADIPDFLVDVDEGATVIECKLRGARKMDVYRQLERYAVHPEVAAQILLTSLAMGLPPEIGGKPVWIVPLGRAWL